MFYPKMSYFSKHQFFGKCKHTFALECFEQDVSTHFTHFHCMVEQQRTTGSTFHRDQSKHKFVSHSKLPPVLPKIVPVLFTEHLFRGLKHLGRCGRLSIASTARVSTTELKIKAYAKSQHLRKSNYFLLSQESCRMVI